nr:hypothetical protein [uncultured Desulfobacter sp.]
MRFINELLKTIDEWNKDPIEDEWVFETFRERYVSPMWLEENVAVMPDRVLKILENLIDRLSSLSEPLYFHQPDALITALKRLLQEADLSDNNEFINRVLNIQDWFLDHGVKELDVAARNKNAQGSE